MTDVVCINLKLELALKITTLIGGYTKNLGFKGSPNSSYALEYSEKPYSSIKMDYRALLIFAKIPTII